jgi:hypothetical protein
MAYPAKVAITFARAQINHVRVPADEIVALLNRAGLTSSTGKPFTVSMIRWIRYKHRT